MININIENLTADLKKMPISILNYNKLYNLLVRQSSGVAYLSAKDIATHWRAFLKNNAGSILKLNYYFPYCVKKCSYCREASQKVKNAKEADDYVIDSLKEIKLLAKTFKNRRFDYLSINGGSPDILNQDNMRKILSALFDNFSFSSCATKRIEFNPHRVSYEKLKMIKRLGVNRVSFGVQSLTKKTLEKANRNYVSYEMLKKTISLAKKAGFKDINIDLILGLPGESYKQFEKNLYKICELDLSQIMVYILNEPNSEYLKKYFHGNAFVFHKRIEKMVLSFVNSQFINEIKRFKYILIPSKKNINYRYFALIKKDLPAFSWISDMDRYINISSLGIGKHNVSNIFGDIIYERNLDFSKNRKIYKVASVDCDYEIRKFIFSSVESARKIKIDLFKQIFKKNIMDIFGSSINVLKNENRIKIENGDILFINKSSKDILIDLALFILGKNSKGQGG